MVSDNERLRTLAMAAGIPVSDEEANRANALLESLMAGIRRLHTLDLGEREPVPAHRPMKGDRHAGE